MRALRLPAGETTTTAAQIVEVDYDPTKADYKPVAKFIGAAYIEVVYTPLKDVLMVVDEEGALDEHQVLNRLASGRFYPDRIWGDALIFSEADTPDRRDFTDLTDEHLALARNLLAFTTRYGGSS